MPADYEPCTVEKVAINAVMAGCRPDYMPVVIAAVEAALDPPFSLHAVVATTMFVGPDRHRERSDPQGDRHELGRQRARPGQPRQLHHRPRAAARRPQRRRRQARRRRPRDAGQSPGKVGFCFAENEEDSCWEPLSVERGIAPGKSAVTLVRRLRRTRRRRPDLAHAGVARAELRRVPVEHAPSQDVRRPRRHRRRFAGAPARVPRGGLVEAALHLGADGVDHRAAPKTC